MVRKIRLDCTLEFGSRADFAIIDVTDGPEKKRGTITIDYAPSDLAELKARGMDFTKALDYYENRIYELVKHYISGDWEPVSGAGKPAAETNVAYDTANETNAADAASDACTTKESCTAHYTTPLKIIEAHIRPQFE